MENFIQNWRGSIYAIWLGGSIAAIFGSSIFDIRWWLVVAPTAIFVMLFNEKRSDW